MADRIAEALQQRKRLSAAEIEDLLKDLKFDPSALLQEIKEVYYRPFKMAWKILLENVASQQVLRPKHSTEAQG